MNNNQKQNRQLPFTLFSTEMMLFGWFRLGQGIESVCPNVDDVVHDTNHVLLPGCNGGVMQLIMSTLHSPSHEARESWSETYD